MTAMGAPDRVESPAAMAGPFDFDATEAYAEWRAWKLVHAAPSLQALVVDVADPQRLDARERQALLQRIAHTNMAIYRGPPGEADAALPRRLGAQLGLQRLDANWLADEDGISHIAVSQRSDDADGGRGGFIPYTDRAIRWHTDGYYHPGERRIRGMILHCVRPAADGGITGLLDHELAYIALRDENPQHVRALMQPDAMTIPAREDADGIARAAQSGPVFAVDEDGALHMRYTARTRSIVWKGDAATQAAVHALERLLAGEHPGILRGRLGPGMGLVGHNVLHERSAFVDDPARPRLLLRARYLDRVQPAGGAPWHIG